MINEILEDAKDRMSKSIESLQGDFAKIRTGRAHPSILDQVMVPYYGSDTPLRQVANVAVEDSRTLTVTPFEKQLVAAVEKAIMTSDLGLNPMSAGQVIRVPLPLLTEERRKELIKVAKGEAEKCRIAIRNIRRDANGDLKELLKEKEISEDEERKGADNIQKITDDKIKEVEVVLAEKEKDLMSF
tara:strand:- start:212 stop:769 length:558 start_codon:yes stop_codon:yes gene_type:complete